MRTAADAMNDVARRALWNARLLPLTTPAPCQIVAKVSIPRRWSIHRGLSVTATSYTSTATVALNVVAPCALWKARLRPFATTEHQGWADEAGAELEELLGVAYAGGFVYLNFGRSGGCGYRARPR